MVLLEFINLDSWWSTNHLKKILGLIFNKKEKKHPSALFFVKISISLLGEFAFKLPFAEMNIVCMLTKRANERTSAGNFPTVVFTRFLYSLARSLPVCSHPLPQLIRWTRSPHKKEGKRFENNTSYNNTLRLLVNRVFFSKVKLSLDVVGCRMLLCRFEECLEYLRMSCVWFLIWSVSRLLRVTRKNAFANIDK